MAVRLTRWIPVLATLAVGGALGWMVEPAFTLDSATGADRGHSDSSSNMAIGRAWLPEAELEQQLQSLSEVDLQGLLVKLDPEFWCGHPNGRDALRVIVRRLAKQRAPAELTREMFRQFRSWNLPAGVRAEILRNLAGALAVVSGVTAEMIGEALQGCTEQEIRAAAAGFAEERRGESIESDAATLHQLLIAAGLKADKLFRIAEELAVAAWFSEQPDAAIAFTLKTPRDFDTAVFRPMLRQLYAVDPAAAVGALKLMAAQGSANYQIGESAFLTGVSAAEFREVWAQVPKDEHVDCMEGFATQLALQSPDSVLELAGEFFATEIFSEHVSKTHTSHRELLALLPLFVERDADECRAWLGTLPAESRGKLLETAAPVLEFLKPAYTRFCIADPEFQLSSSHASHLLSAIAAEDLDAALRELPRVPESERLNVEANLRGRSIISRFDGDVAGALQALGQIPGNLRKEVSMGVYPTLATKYLTLLQQWIASNGDSPEANALRVYLANNDAFLSNAHREELLARSLPMIDLHPGVAGAAESHIRSLAETDPAKAAEWFARIPDGERKSSIAQSLAERWAVTDLASAVAWAEQLPPSPSRDGAMLELADKLRSQPEQAFVRIVQISDGEKRFTAAQSFVRDWALADPERAITFLAEVPLSEEQKRKLEAMIEASPTYIRQATP